MHLGLTYANCTTGAQSNPIGDFFGSVVVGGGGGGMGWGWGGWGGGGIPPEYTIWISCSCNAIYMHLHTILWWYIMRFATLVSLGRTSVGHQYFPHVGPESTCCSINKKLDPWNSRQNKLKSQLYRLKTFGLSLGFHELWYLKKRLK